MCCGRIRRLASLDASRFGSCINTLPTCHSRVDYSAASGSVWRGLRADEVHERLMGLRLICALALVAALAGCAGLGGADDPARGPADAQVAVGNHHFSVWFDRKETTVFVKGGAGAGRALVSVLTLNAVTFIEPVSYWRAAAQAILTPIGCTVSELHALGDRSTWQVSYACPVGVDAVAEMEAHREEWRGGVSAPDPAASPSPPPP